MIYNFHLRFIYTSLFVTEKAHSLVEEDVCKDPIYWGFEDLGIVIDLLSFIQENSFLYFMSLCC